MKADETVVGSLLKEHLAAAFKQGIIDGRLSPGERVVEAAWAKEFSVAQASIREAINLLISEGFLIKDAGRSARVVNYREQDVAHIYQVRSALEGLAAQLACAAQADLSLSEQALERMSEACAKNEMKELVQSDLAFHLGLAQASGNGLLADTIRRLLFPLFAFIQMRALASGQGPQAWLGDLEKHRLILRFIREGNPVLANQITQHCMSRFAVSAYAVWENKGGAIEAHQQQKPKRANKNKVPNV
jgi:DNA-binding GntR family transcriptional regulator